MATHPSSPGQIQNIQISNGPNSDAFGRLRISAPETLFDINHLYTKQSLMIDEKTASGATSTHLPNEASVRLDVTTTIGSRIVRQSKRYIPYQPGKSMLVFMTGVLHTAVNTGIIARMGLFDNHSDKSVDSGGNGIFLEYNGGSYYITKRSYVSGSQVDTQIAKASWNIDKFDGTGPSSITLDFTKAQILVIDLEWLGVGRVRVGFDIGGTIYYAHEFLHANLLTSVYMTRAALPIRYELEQISGASTASMKMICASVSSEGGYSPRGKVFAADRGITGATVNNTEVPVISIRSKTTFNRINIAPLEFAIMCSTTANLRFSIYIGAALTGATWAVSSPSESAVEIDIAASAVTLTNAVRLHTGYFSGAVDFAMENFVNTINYLSSNIAGTSDILTVTAQNTAGVNETVFAGLCWQEQG
jgi:hypothetical protein